MLDRLDDTIVAVSTAPGRGPVGIVRLSGAEAIGIVDQMVPVLGDSPLAKRPTGTRVGSAEVRIDGELSLPSTLYLFRAPRSYTREDLVEIHAIGAPVALDLVRRRAIALGARQAGPGEFTARAFLNGTMDLARAEAVAGIIRAGSDAQLRAARRMMDGALSQAILHARDALGELLALVEADIDFSDEPIDFVAPAEARMRLTDVVAQLQRLLADSLSAERLERLPHVLLLGPPNVGKSTLMNRLSGTSRAICASVAGTTRDILAAPMRVGRGEAILLDSAGVDQRGDAILSAARANTMAAAGQVDLVCLVLDATGESDLTWLQQLHLPELATVIVTANKCDLIPPERIEVASLPVNHISVAEVCPVSARTGWNIEKLRTMIAERLGEEGGILAEESIVLNERQRSAIETAMSATQRAMALCASANQTIDCADVLAFELREALDALGAVTGDVTTEDLLGQVFSRFCIGK